MYPDGEYQGEIYREVSLYLGEDTSTGKIYRNFVLPEKAVIYCEDSGIRDLLTVKCNGSVSGLFFIL